MKKPYRNALRSKQMIRDAFIDLLSEKPLEKITVVDIVNRSGLSRNTFYAHYQDVYAVLEEYQHRWMQLMQQLLDEAVAKQEYTDPLPLLQKVADHVDENKGVYQVLLNAGQQASFIMGVKKMLVQRVLTNLNATNVRDKNGYILFVDVIATGFIHLIQLYLQNEIDLTSSQIIQEIDKMYCTGITAYI